MEKGFLPSGASSKLQSKLFTFIFLICLNFSHAIMGAELKAINYTQKGSVSELEFLFDAANVVANSNHVKEDKQIIVDLKNVTATERVIRSFDTSEFKGAVVFVSAYVNPKNKNDLRVALQLRDNVRSVLKRKDNRVVLEIENRHGVFSQKELENNGVFEENEDKISKNSSEDGVAPSERINIPKSNSVEDILNNLVQSGK